MAWEHLNRADAIDQKVVGLLRGNTTSLWASSVYAEATNLRLAFRHFTDTITDIRARPKRQQKAAAYVDFCRLSWRVVSRVGVEKSATTPPGNRS